MSDKALSSLLTALIVAALAVWVPLLEAFAWMRHRRPASLRAEVQSSGAGPQRAQPARRSAA